MKLKEENLRIALPIWLVDLFLIISLISLLSIPLALARESQNPADAAPSQQAAQTAAATDPEKTMTQALDVFEAGNSIDFLMEAPTLTQSTSPDTALPTMIPAGPPESNSSREPSALQTPQIPAFQAAEEVAMLVSEQCNQSGKTTDGMNSCVRVYSNGHRATVLTQNANEGDEIKHQTVIEEFDGNHTLLYRKTIRHRLDYNYLKDQKAKGKEFFDIIYQPAGRKTTRELMVYEYFLDTGKAKSLSWTQYQQISNEPKAELIYHALLRYGDDGNPDRGLAERWSRGQRAETFMNWSRRSKGFATLDEITWEQWEGWIRNVSLQAYLP
jgi:hypothetical protein